MNLDKENLIFIYESLLHIKNFTKGGEAKFHDSELISSGTIRKFEVIGESVKNLSPELRSNFPEILWKDLAGFRDVLIHKSMMIDTDVVWESVEVDVPKLLVQFEEVLNRLEIEIPVISKF